jgi:hypothetical protein
MGSMKNKIVATELVEERAKCNIDQRELFVLFAGSEEQAEILLLEQKKILADPALQNGFEFYDMTREEQMYSWMKKLNHLWFNKPK